MRKIVSFYKDKLVFSQLVIERMTWINRTFFSIAIFTLFCGVVFTPISVINLNYSYKYTTVTIVISLTIINICVNKVLVENYEMKKTIMNALRINWEFIEAYRVNALMDFLNDLGYDNENQIQVLIDISNDYEKYNKFNGVLSKALFTTGLVSILASFIQAGINSVSNADIFKMVNSLIFIVLMISFVTFLFERSFEWLLKFYMSSESKIYMKIKMVLKLILLEKYKTL